MHLCVSCQMHGSIFLHLIRPPHRFHLPPPPSPPPPLPPLPQPLPGASPCLCAPPFHMPCWPCAARATRFPMRHPRPPSPLQAPSPIAAQSLPYACPPSPSPVRHVHEMGWRGNPGGGGATGGGGGVG